MPCHAMAARPLKGYACLSERVTARHFANQVRMASSRLLGMLLARRKPEALSADDFLLEGNRLFDVVRQQAPPTVRTTGTAIHQAVSATGGHRWYVRSHTTV